MLNPGILAWIHQLSFSQMASIGAAVDFTRVCHLALSSASHVAANMDKPVCFLMMCVHAVGGQPLPRRPSFTPCKMFFSILPCFLHICSKYHNFLVPMLFKTWDLSQSLLTAHPINQNCLSKIWPWNLYK